MNECQNCGVPAGRLQLREMYGKAQKVCSNCSFAFDKIKSDIEAGRNQIIKPVDERTKRIRMLINGLPRSQ